MFLASTFLREHFADVDGVIGAIGEHWSETPDRETVRKWFARGRVSGGWWPVLLITLEKNTGAPVSLAPYVSGGENNGIFA